MELLNRTKYPNAANEATREILQRATIMEPYHPGYKDRVIEFICYSIASMPHNIKELEYQHELERRMFSAQSALRDINPEKMSISEFRIKVLTSLEISKSGFSDIKRKKRREKIFGWIFAILFLFVAFTGGGGDYVPLPWK